MKKKPELVCLSELNIGDTFISTFSYHVYMLTDRITTDNAYAAVRLSNGILYNFAPEHHVKPVTCEIIIKEDDND